MIVSTRRERKVNHEKTQTSPGAAADGINVAVYAHPGVGSGSEAEKHGSRGNAGGPAH